MTIPLEARSFALLGTFLILLPSPAQDAPRILPSSRLAWDHTGLDIEGRPDRLTAAQLALSCPSVDLNAGDVALATSREWPAKGAGEAPVADLLSGRRPGRYLIWCRVKDRSKNWSVWGDPLLVELAAEDGDPAADALCPELEAPLFRRGDANADRVADLSDPIFLLLFIFRGERPPPCPDAADADDSSRLELTDAIYMLSYLFRGGPLPPSPGPRDCGRDPTKDGLMCDAYPPCAP